MNYSCNIEIQACTNEGPPGSVRSELVQNLTCAAIEKMLKIILLELVLQIRLYLTRNFIMICGVYGVQDLIMLMDESLYRHNAEK